MDRCEKSETACLKLIDEKIELGRSLADKLERDFIKIEGALKTKRSVAKEIQFLQKVSKKIILKVEVAFTSHPTHFSLK